MPPFPKPAFPYDYDPKVEIEALRRHRRTRGVPDRGPGTLLIATWNIANLGLQERRSRDRALIAEILGWFDLVAIQEVNDNWTDLMDIQHGQLGDGRRVLLSDAAGNNERMAFLYDPDRVRPLELIGEVAFPPSQYGRVKLPGIRRAFNGFDRTPYLATFAAGRLSFTLVSVHLFYGSENKQDVERRALETFAVALWADREARSRYSFTRDIIALGDFNMPKAEPGDPIYEALTARGLELPDHSSGIGSSIASDSRYDQIAFFPGETRRDFTGRKGVFDFDAVVFADLWAARAREQFNGYVRYHLSDHRPLWAEFRTAGIPADEAAP